MFPDFRDSLSLVFGIAMPIVEDTILVFGDSLRMNYRCIYKQ